MLDTAVFFHSSRTADDWAMYVRSIVDPGIGGLYQVFINLGRLIRVGS